MEQLRLQRLQPHLRRLALGEVAHEGREQPPVADARLPERDLYRERGAVLAQAGEDAAGTVVLAGRDAAGEAVPGAPRVGLAMSIETLWPIISLPA